MGWVYNLQDPNAPTHAPRLIAICTTFSTLALLAVALRFYVRIKTQRFPWFDDYATLSSAILGFAYTAVAIAQTRWGQALDFKYFPPENIIPFSKVQYAGGPIYTLALLGFKLSLLTSYLRIGGFILAYKYTIYAVIFLCTCNQIIFTLVITLACNPVSKQWNFSEPGHCIDTLASYYAIAGTSLCFDLIIIFLPLPVLWKLQLHKKQKMVLTGLFALGFFITIIQVFRIFTIARLKHYTDSEPIVIWSCVEISLGVIIACVPTYGPLFKSFASGFSSYRSRQRDQSYKLNSQTRQTHNTSHHGKSGSQSRSQNWDYDMDEFDRVHDPNTQHTTTIMSAKLNKGGRLPDSSSEEHILVDRPNDNSHDPIQIHTMTEVKVESRNV